MALWAAAAREAWRCEGGRAVQAGECWLSVAEGVYSMSAGIRLVFPRMTVPAPGGWLDAGLRAWCGM